MNGYLVYQPNGSIEYVDPDRFPKNGTWEEIAARRKRCERVPMMCDPECGECRQIRMARQIMAERRS